MRVGEAAAQAALTVRAVHYYEALGLVVPDRGGNGYRDYQPADVRLLREIRALTELGLPANETRPFLECLSLGHAEADDCPAALAAYRESILVLSAQLEELARRRAALLDRLDRAARRGRDGPTGERVTMTDFDRLPESLPVPTDDGGADHLDQAPMPALSVPATDGSRVTLDALGSSRTVLYFYPLTGRPGVDLPNGWDEIPGARGCTPEACDFRDHHVELVAAGADAVYGVSAQDTPYQLELVDRLRLPFPLLSDPQLRIAAALELPTFEAAEQRLYRRLTLVVRDGRVEHVFYPIFPPDQHAQEVLRWLHANPA